MKNLYISLSLGTRFSNECRVVYEQGAHANELLEVLLEGESFDGVATGDVVTHRLTSGDARLVQLHLEYARGPITEIEMKRRAA